VLAEVGWFVLGKRKKKAHCREKGWRSEQHAARQEANNQPPWNSMRALHCKYRKRDKVVRDHGYIGTKAREARRTGVTPLVRKTTRIENYERLGKVNGRANAELARRVKPAKFLFRKIVWQLRASRHFQRSPTVTHLTHEFI